MELGLPGRDSVPAREPKVGFRFLVLKHPENLPRSAGRFHRMSGEENQILLE
jgi:hypothetical protein